MTFPFDTGSPDSWSWIGYGNTAVNANGTSRGDNISEVRLNPHYIDNAFDTVKFDLAWNINSIFSLHGGLAWKDYDMSTREYRHVSYGRLPRTLPDGVDVANLSITLNGFGKNLKGNFPSNWLIPDFDKVSELLGIHCDCDTGLPGGDYRLLSIAHFGATVNNFEINEKSLSTYMQLDFNTDLMQRPLRGNVGVRVARTDIETSGWAPCVASNIANNSANCQTFFGVASNTADVGDRFLIRTGVNHRYHDVLPALNLSWEVLDDIVLRFGAAKTMARPTLTWMSPGISGSPSGYFDDGRVYSINIGNPKLKPYRSTNYDLSAEWYFQQGGLLAAALFYKDIESYIQRTRLLSTWGDLGYSLEMLPEGFAAETIFNVQSYYNTEGGALKGYEISWQQPFTFLPRFWRNFGTQFNYTHVGSKVQYVFSASANSNTQIVTTTTEADLINLSPKSWNATLYYDDGRFSARISSSYRDGYINNILSRETVYDLDGNELLTPDTTGKYSVRNVDFNMSWRFSKKLSLTFEAVNLLDTEDRRYVDSRLKLLDRYAVTGRQYYAGVRYRF